MDTARLIPRSLEEDAYRSIREAILSGDLQPGDPLVEAQISEQFGVSKTPIREALIRLKRDGLVESAPHRVNRVATPTADDIRQACKVRAWIETQLTAELAENPEPALLEQLKASIDAAERALKSNDDHAYVMAIRGFSEMLVQASGNRYAAYAIDRLVNATSLIANVSRRAPSRKKSSIEEHRQIYQALCARDPQAAAEATMKHLRSIEQDSLDALGSAPSSEN